MLVHPSEDDTPSSSDRSPQLLAETGGKSADPLRNVAASRSWQQQLRDKAISLALDSNLYG